MKNTLLSILTICIMLTFVVCVQSTIAKDGDSTETAIKAEDQAEIDAQRAKVQEMLEQRRKTRRMPQPISTKDKMDIDRKRLKTIDQQIDRRKQEHTDFVEQLKAAKKMALEEKATKTAEMLDRIIKKQQQRFDRTMGNYQQSRSQIREQFQQENLPAAATTAETSTDKTEESGEKEARWWQFWK